MKTIAVDLDGTLAEYHGWKGKEHIGKIIPAMKARVDAWLGSGHRVVIFTARASDQQNIPPIKRWLEQHGYNMLVTCVKSPDMAEIWDDRAVGVNMNKGTINNTKGSAFEKQVGGGHYKDMAIQPIEFCHKNKLGTIESGIIKYVVRHGKKGGKKKGLEDINKAIHLLELLKELDYEDIS